MISDNPTAKEKHDILYSYTKITKRNVAKGEVLRLKRKLNRKERKSGVA
jgi:hypothetical protein